MNRIQRERTRGWRMPPDARSVTRPGPFGNPFKVGDLVAIGMPFPGLETFTIETAEQAVALYRAWLLSTRDGRLIAERARRELRGKRLACYCPLPQPGQPDHCHAAVLLEVANRKDSACRG